MTEAQEQRCSRCGAPEGIAVSGCYAYTKDPTTVIACRDRELANVRALLRGATIALERVATELNDILEVIS